MAAVKRLPVHHYSADYIFWSFGVIGFVFNFFFENRVLLKPVLGGMASVPHFIIGHDQSQLNQVRYFYFFGVFFASKGPYYSELLSSP